MYNDGRQCTLLGRMDNVAKLNHKADQVKKYLNGISYFTIYNNHIIYWDKERCISAPCVFHHEKLVLGVNKGDSVEFAYNLSKYDLRSKIKAHLSSHFGDISDMKYDD